MDRFAFEYAERTLDTFAGTVESKQFCRSYAKFRFVLGIYAYCDFSYPKMPTVKAVACAWEDAQVAFTGYGEPALHGVILQMWTTLPVHLKDRFKEAIETGFRLAEEHTDPSVARRYLAEWREKPIRDPDLGFNLPTILPVTGPKILEWAEEEGFDPLEHEEYLRYLEVEERNFIPQPKKTTGLLVFEGGQREKK